MATFGNPLLSQRVALVLRYVRRRMTGLEESWTYRTVCTIVQVVVFFIIVQWVARITV